MKAKFVDPFNSQIKEELEKLKNTHPKKRIRERSHALLLSADGYQLAEIADILTVQRDTVSHWIDKFNLLGIKGLSDKPIPGRPSKLSREEKKTGC